MVPHRRQTVAAGPAPFVEHDASPAFAAVSLDGVRLRLSGEGSSGKRPLPDGRRQESGGWNRLRLRVPDLEHEVKRLRAAEVPFRTEEIVGGPVRASSWIWSYECRDYVA